MNRKLLYTLLAVPALVLSVALLVMVAVKYRYLPEVLPGVSLDGEPLMRSELWVFVASAFLLSLAPLGSVYFPRLRRVNSGLRLKDIRQRGVPVMPRYELRFQLGLTATCFLLVLCFFCRCMVVLLPSGGGDWLYVLMAIAIAGAVASTAFTCYIARLNNRAYRSSKYDNQ